MYIAYEFVSRYLNRWQVLIDRYSPSCDVGSLSSCYFPSCDWSTVTCRRVTSRLTCHVMMTCAMTYCAAAVSLASLVCVHPETAAFLILLSVTAIVVLDIAFELTASLRLDCLD